MQTRQWISRVFWLLLGRFADAFQVLGVSGVAGMTGSFALPAWAASATGWLAAYGPIAWVVAGFAGVLIFALAMLMWGRFQLYLATKRVIEMRMEPGDAINPFDESFTKKRIRPASLVDPISNSISGKTFHGCDIIGPVNFTVSGATLMQSCTFAAVDHVEVPENTRLQNGIRFHECSFNRCRFIFATMIVPTKSKHIIPAEAHWITDRPQLDQSDGSATD